MVRVMVVDDHPMWREGVSRDLAAAGYEVVATTGEGRQAVRIAAAARPDVVVLDLQLPDVSGVEVINGLLAAVPGVRVLMLSASGEQQSVLDAVKAGASGYLLKSAAQAEFLDAVGRTAAGDTVFTPGLAGLVLGEFRRLAVEPPGAHGTTPEPNPTGNGVPPPGGPGGRGSPTAPRRNSPSGRPRCSAWWRRACPTGRSPSGWCCRTARCR